MAKWVLAKIQAEVKEARYYTIIADETKDVSKCEQLSVVLRYIYKNTIHERFLGFTHAEQLDASALTEYILEVLRASGIALDDCISQCYDGASVMSGCSSGVSARILEKNHKAIYSLLCSPA